MNNYIRERIRADAAHLVQRSGVEEQIVHDGIRGRFRELLTDALLAPWLPPYAACGTGMIVDVENRARDATQEDVVVFDRSLVPPVIAHAGTHEGVFPLDGVLMRIEVKSTLNATGVRQAVAAASEIFKMKFSGPPNRVSMLPTSAIFAFGSDLTGEPRGELERLLRIVRELDLHFRAPCQDVPGPIGALCVVGRGSWLYGSDAGGNATWKEAVLRNPHDEIISFLGTASNSCFATHADREGREQTNRGAGGGIGQFIFGPDTHIDCPVQVL